MAKPIILDLNFRVVSSTHQVFIAFPGKGYSLYQRFVALNRIFPQLPGLDLIKGKKIEEQPNLLEKIARARRLAKWYRSRRQGDAPSRRLADYKRLDASLYQIKGVVAGFFERASKGDLVVVPPSDIFGQVLVGELQDEPHEFSTISIPELYDTDEVPTRKVKWLANAPKTELSLDMLRKFPKPNPFTFLDRDLYREVYALAYGSYSIEDSFTSRFDVTQADFSTIDDYHIQQIFNAVAALCQRVETDPNVAKSIASAEGWDGIIDLLSDKTYIPDLSVNINSPGSLTLSCQKVVPLVVAALLALASLGAEATWNAAQANEIKIENSGAPPNDACSAQVAKETIEQLKMMGFQRWQSLCKKAEEAKKSTGLQEQSKVK